MRRNVFPQPAVTVVVIGFGDIPAATDRPRPGPVSEDAVQFVPVPLRPGHHPSVQV